MAGNIDIPPIRADKCLFFPTINRENIMSVVPVADVLQGRVAVDQEVTVRGWVRTRRDSKAGISFLAVYDGSCFDPVQAVINNSLPNYNDDVLHLTTGCSVIVTGVVVASPGQGQSYESQARSVAWTGWVESPDSDPMAAKRHSSEYLREVAHLRPRTTLIGAVARVRHTLAQAPHRFFAEQGYFWVSTPLITASDTEGAGEMLDRKSTRLNSSHVKISYAVFCLKKKKKEDSVSSQT